MRQPKPESRSSYRPMRAMPDFRLADLRRALWLAILVAASVGFTLGLACAMPFAALGAAVALTLPKRDALLITGAAWFANQVVGFAVLSYPWTASTLAWGVALGLVAIVTTATAQWLVQHLKGRNAVVVGLLSFAAAFIAYEGTLFVIAATLLGGTEDFAPAIVTRILEINAAAFAGLLVLHRLGIAAGLTVRPGISVAAGARHA